jgi:hypothetical protein
LVAPNQLEETSDTYELTRNWANGVYKVNTPKSQAIVGFIGGAKLNTKYLETNISTNNAAVIVQSLDNNYIDKSGELLISIGTRSNPKAGNKLPFHVEPIHGAISIRAKPGLKAYRVSNIALDAITLPPKDATTTDSATSQAPNQPASNTATGVITPSQDVAGFEPKVTDNVDATGSGVMETMYPVSYLDGQYQFKFDGASVVTWLILK